MQKQWDVLGIGCAAADDLLYVDHYPAPDAKTPVEHSERQCGGLTATALVAAARHGASCAFAGALGQDELSDFVLWALEEEGIDTSGVARLEGNAPIHSTIIVDRTTGTRNIFFQRPTTIGAVPGSPTDQQVQSSRVLFVDHYGGEETVRLQKLARQAGVPTVADLERSDVPCFNDILENSDHLIVSQDFAAQLTGKSDPTAAVSALLRPNMQLVIVTCGTAGCWSVIAENPTPVHHPAFKVQTVDTTGCGDTFHGVYAAELARNADLTTRITRASAAAAIKSMSRGAQKGIPSRPHVDEFLAKQQS